MSTLLYLPSMGRGKRRGPKPLHFLALRSGLDQAINNIENPRRQASISYQLRDSYQASYAMFCLRTDGRG